MMLKRVLSLAAAACCLFALATGCQSAPAEKAKITIDLKSNPSTGYDWKVENDDKVKLLSSDPVSQASTKATGVPHVNRYIFEPVAPGETSIIFTYARDWEGGETAYSVTYQLTIDSELNMRCDSITPKAIDGSIEGVEFPNPLIAK